jgi:hypothetical protein
VQGEATEDEVNDVEEGEAAAEAAAAVDTPQHGIALMTEAAEQQPSGARQK